MINYGNEPIGSPVSILLLVGLRLLMAVLGFAVAAPVYQVWGPAYFTWCIGRWVYLYVQV